MCWRPQPSLTRFGKIDFRMPVRLGVWNTHTSTRSGPNSSTSLASRLAHDGAGASLVPRRASVVIDIRKSGLALRTSRIASIFQHVSSATGSSLTNAIPIRIPLHQNTESLGISCAWHLQSSSVSVVLVSSQGFKGVECPTFRISKKSTGDLMI